MEKPQIAMASVKVQAWGPLYNEHDALKNGTIFQELDKPFFAAVDIPRQTGKEAFPKSEEQKQREVLMQKIMEVSFALDDLSLYLDMHETEEQALILFQEMGKLRHELKKEFAQTFYPLTRDCMDDGDRMERYAWQNGPLVWEGGCV